MTASPATDAVQLFVPAHITGLFSVHRRDAPRTTGSRGAGITLTDGIHLEIAPAERTQVELDGSAIHVSAVDQVCEAFDQHATIRIHSDVPLGSGFGVSGAMALGTALGLNTFAAQPRTENELTEIAHVADVEAGTGLGDVVAQMRGGIPLRREPGAPGYGELDGIAARARIEYLPLGDLSTQTVLSGDLTQLNAAGEAALDRLLADPTLDRFMEEASRFARASDLLTADVATVLETVNTTAPQASMAMLGRTVFAVGTALSDAGYEPASCAIDVGGARRTDVGVFNPADDHEVV